MLLRLSAHYVSARFPRLKNWRGVGAYLLVATIGCSISMVSNAHSDDLAYYLPPGEVRWLGASDDEIAAAREADDDTPLRALMLYRENQQAFDRGNLLLISEIGTHPLQSAPMRHWYQGMPAYGWYTYALQSPPQGLFDVDWVGNDTQRYSAAPNIDALRDALAERITLAVEEVMQTPGPLVIVAEGVSAALVSELIQQGELAGVDALVVLGAHFPHWQLNQDLATTTARLNIPTLDLIPSVQNTWVTDAAARRQQQAQRHQHIAYRQRALQHQRLREQPRYLIHQLYGWLRSEDF